MLRARCTLESTYLCIRLHVLSDVAISFQPYHKALCMKRDPIVCNLSGKKGICNLQEPSLGRLRGS